MFNYDKGLTGLAVLFNPLLSPNPQVQPFSTVLPCVIRSRRKINEKKNPILTQDGYEKNNKEKQ